MVVLVSKIESLMKMMSDTKTNPVIIPLEPGEFLVNRPDDPGLTGLDDVFIRERGNNLVASTRQDDLIDYINKNVKQGNPLADRIIYRMYKDWKTILT